MRNNKKEIEALFDDLLINVTRFFRDEALFRALKKRFLPTLLKNKKKDRQRELRVWVPGCATGEEVYSLAICLLEVLGNQLSKIRVQIFGTDLSESVIEHARAGIYPNAIRKMCQRRDSIAFSSGAMVPIRSIATYAISARSPDKTSPPIRLSRELDLVSCRNVLIYLSPELHKRCIPRISLRAQSRRLFDLGPAESVGMYDELFELVDKKNKIYTKEARLVRPRPVSFHRPVLDSRGSVRQPELVLARILTATF